MALNCPIGMHTCTTPTFSPRQSSKKMNQIMMYGKNLEILELKNNFLFSFSQNQTSFVVDECSEDERNDQEMSVLERAEWLMQMERREKRKITNNSSSNSNSVPKRRKIIQCTDSSDENT